MDALFSIVLVLVLAIVLYPIARWKKRDEIMWIFIGIGSLMSGLAIGYWLGYLMAESMADFYGSTVNNYLGHMLQFCFYGALGGLLTAVTTLLLLPRKKDIKVQTGLLDGEMPK